jgi:hypothetical protein
MNCSSSCSMCYGITDINPCHPLCLSCIRIQGYTATCPVCGSVLTINPVIDKTMTWIYEGRNNGWWYYTPEVQRALDKAYQSGKKSISWYLRSCGQTVTLDLVKMEQTNPHTDGVRRIVNLTEPSSDYLIKGIGGIPT